MSFRLDRRFRSTKVPPTITPSFWGLKILTTAMGEATSDFFVNRFDPRLAVVCAAVVFAVVLWWQLRAPTYLTVTYWGAVVMVSVFGTMCADVVHVEFKVPYTVSAITFALVLIVVFAMWNRVEGTLSIHSITTTRRELFYWAAVTVAFALGTAVGDFTAYTAKLGYFSSGLLFTGLIILPALGFWLARTNSVLMFWIAYVLTRPLGASYADWMGKPKLVSGLGWGSGNVSLVLTAVIVVGVGALAAAEARQKREVRL
ncbi:MAG TPA: hypothetical protein VMU68_07455 [Acidimicrobiales bacterium]|nr:hypothetical protein [Acidimicrobiales bacterium]